MVVVAVVGSEKTKKGTYDRKAATANNPSGEVARSTIFDMNSKVLGIISLSPRKSASVSCIGVVHCSSVPTDLSRIRVVGEMVRIGTTRRTQRTDMMLAHCYETDVNTSESYTGYLCVSSYGHNETDNGWWSDVEQ